MTIRTGNRKDAQMVLHGGNRCLLAIPILLFSTAFQPDNLQIGLTLSNYRAEAIARQRVTGALRMWMLLLYWQLT